MPPELGDFSSLAERDFADGSARVMEVVAVIGVKKMHRPCALGDNSIRGAKLGFARGLHIILHQMLFKGTGGGPEWV
jgi:hypothetical protein